MYYNSNQNSNEYYSSYKQELSEIEEKYNSKNSLSLPLKAGLGVLILGLLAGSLYYSIKNFSTENKEQSNILINTKTEKTPPIKTEKIPKIIIAKEQLPKSIQLQKSESKIILNLKKNSTDSLEIDSPLNSSEHNAIKKEVIALDETSNMNADEIDHIVNLILSKQKEKDSLEKELSEVELEKSEAKTLKESNHYNKVVVSTENKNNKLKTLANTKNNKIKLTQYEKDLTPELATRSNEMRVIVVKKGDTLSKLAKKAYGDIKAYDKIFKANPEIIKNPNQIFVGQKIRIPK